MADEKEGTVATGESSAGAPETMPEVIPESAEQPPPPELLDRKQAALTERRRQGGPPLVETDEEASAVSLPDEPETECEPPDRQASR